MMLLKKTGQNPSIKYWKSGCDGSMSCGIHKIPTIGYSFGSEKLVHKPKERVNIDRMLDTIDGYIENCKKCNGCKKLKMYCILWRML